MLQQFLHNSSETHTSRRILIGAPLVLVAVFSFAFVSWQPTDSAGDESAASKSTTSTATDAVEQASAPPSDIPLAETSLPTLDQATPVESGSTGNAGGVSSTTSGVGSATSNGSRVKTANPQQSPQKSSAPNSTSPQAASAAGQYYVSPDQQINVSLPSLTKLLGF